jgi:hypothetical protein
MAALPRYWVQYTQTIRETGKPDIKEDCVAGFTRSRPIADFADLEQVVHDLKAATLQNHPHLSNTNLTITVRSWQRFEDTPQIIVPVASRPNLKV